METGEEQCSVSYGHKIKQEGAFQGEVKAHRLWFDAGWAPCDGRDIPS